MYCLVSGLRVVPSPVRANLTSAPDFFMTTVWIVNNSTDMAHVAQVASSTFADVRILDELHLHVGGASSLFAALFDTVIASWTNEHGSTSFAPTSDIIIPGVRPGAVRLVLGLDNICVCRPRSHMNAHADSELQLTSHSSSNSFTVSRVTEQYRFPPVTAADGRGQTIALIELGGGFLETDIQATMASLPSAYAQYTPQVTSRFVAGATGMDFSDLSATTEVNLDIQVVLPVVPAAQIVVYFAPNSDYGFYEAIRQAGVDGCHVISISWGAPESAWSSGGLSAFDALFATLRNRGISVTVASGDLGARDGTPQFTVDFPAGSPNVLSCGGTTMPLQQPSQEIVWNADGYATGGGKSRFFARPFYQQLVVPGETMRCVPDWSGNADPAVGYPVIMNGRSRLVGGTSAVAPLFGSLLIQALQLTSGKAVDVLAILYAAQPTFRDIRVGNNNGYSAQIGYDLCTGLGTPNAQRLLAGWGVVYLAQSLDPAPSESETGSWVCLGVCLAIFVVALALLVWITATMPN